MTDTALSESDQGGRLTDAPADAESHVFFTPHQIAVEFFEATKPLDDRQRDWLLAQGVSDAALRGDPGRETAELRMARVVFDRAYFDFAHCGDEDARPALVVIARDEFGTVDDLVAFDKRGRIGAWLGRAALLGEQMLNYPRIESPALTVFPDGLSWLRADRRGVVILNPVRACWRLTGESLAVADAAHGRRLRAALRLPEPQIFVASNSARRAA